MSMLTGIDLGSANIPGSVSENAGVWTVQGSGASATLQRRGHFAYQPFSGDGTITARVVSIIGPSTFSYASLSWFGELASTALFSQVLSDVADGIGLNWLSTPGGSWSGAFHATVQQPVWLRLTRSGNAFSGYCSTNGTDWTQVSTTKTIAMPSDAFVGLMVSSHSTSTTESAVGTFDNLSGFIVPTPIPIFQNYYANMRD